jgi:catechol 2,3-dioxygenase-like lactoylglutathione lyase family enzyme
MSVLSESRVGVVIQAQNLDRAKRFYRDTLGLKVVNEDEVGVEFEAGGGSQLLVYPRPGGMPAEHTVAAWAVDDLESAMEDLKGRGVDFERYDLPGLKTDARGIAQMNGSRGAWFKDSEGNIIGIGEFA